MHILVVIPKILLNNLRNDDLMAHVKPNWGNLIYPKINTSKENGKGFSNLPRAQWVYLNTNAMLFPFQQKNKAKLRIGKGSTLSKINNAF